MDVPGRGSTVCRTGHWVMNSLVWLKTPFGFRPRLARYTVWCGATCDVRSLLLACLLICPLIAPPVAYGVCRSPKNICKHISNCLDRKVDPNNNIVVQIRDGARTHNGRIVRAAADLCAADLGVKRDWDKWSAGCSDIEYVTIAKAEMEHGTALCDRYSQ